MKKIFLLLFCCCVVFSAWSQTTPIRGTWITNVGSKALLNEANVKAAVSLCKEKGINTIFMVVWNDGLTMYPSKVVERYIGIKQDTVYKGFDPLKCMIAEGHKQGIKVHAWFEFGFSYAYKDSNSIWYKKYPHWVGRNSKKERLQKSDFYWWNAMHPEVQSFMLQLVKEVVKKYDIDGVQGDDRLPAMPGEGGYDDYTVALYKKQTGKTPPADFKEPHWLQWKANQLSAFGKKLYRQVKKIKPSCMVTWSPSIYPWSMENYLQDWPTWVKGGYADIILPQLYRYDIKAYEKILKELDSQISPQQKKKTFPGILTGLANGYQISDELLQQMIALNRKYGFEGECLFYFESLHKIKSLY